MRRIISFTIMLSIKIAARLFYKTKINYLSPISWEHIKLILVINHTSLYEPLFLTAAPNWFIWKLAGRLVGPGADKTLNRPIVGIFWRFMAGPGLVAISRKRDHTWREFLDAIGQDSVIAIAPEGRMKRANGLDLDGKPMNVKKGICDILEQLDYGSMLMLYSGGLHHIQIPGQTVPKIFQTLRVAVEEIEINEYKKRFIKHANWKDLVVEDLEYRLHHLCPKDYVS